MMNVWDKAVEWKLDGIILAGLNRFQNHSDEKRQAILNSLKILPFSINYRATGVYGYHHPRRGIELNNILFKPELMEDMDKTFLHEVAHHLADKLFGSATLYPYNGYSYDKVGQTSVGHGEYWKRVMVSLGQSPERTAINHSQAAKDALIQKQATRANHKYVCKDCGFEISKIRRLKLNGALHFHRNCRNKPNKGFLKQLY